MTEEKEEIKKGCTTCIKTARRGCNSSKCLTDREDGKGYEYNEYEEGDPVAEILKMERAGDRNIVIGGAGEAEINIKWSIEEAYKRLCDVSEQCGYITTRPSNYRLEISTHEGLFSLEWMNDKFYRIQQIRCITVWTDRD